jgi:hypothetical protein
MGLVRAPILRMNGQNGPRSRADFAREWTEIKKPPAGGSMFLGSVAQALLPVFIGSQLSILAILAFLAIAGATPSVVKALGLLQMFKLSIFGNTGTLGNCRDTLTARMALGSEQWTHTQTLTKGCRPFRVSPVSSFG